MASYNVLHTENENKQDSNPPKNIISEDLFLVFVPLCSFKYFYFHFYHDTVTNGENFNNKSAVLLINYRGADKSLARPGRKQATATEDFEFHTSYL